ncbi:2-succinyl-5-enolpyruvyl-6-hydroxy-3-cyclohexene-1-carboxylate synthase [Polaribacter sp. BAL334]|uniref:thiamine pyrophosphate-binding protein n=1 Tax=Polaribacter sp. BAL334 TaxID=1708178 RepID=UPI0018D2309A|nr:thiamine pyrophosphate-binding protein [Polaribacter sp. BAL334]MBG7611720.1 2-succinyl-5-enolpyruvyl-6-hydroxy-3-cyclohexene-1-carboxylate synthase [Polaribacter sp. BAL334]
MRTYYTDEKNVQVIISLLKQNNIKRVVASPGSTNITFVASIQDDPFFEVYSSVDERSAAYMACGIAAETDEPVVLSCTGATASRNYFPGLTEAFYRKLPILSITSHQGASKIGHNIAQILDVSVMPKDTAKLVIDLPVIKDEDDLWDCEIKVNKAILELKRHGGGPVHINLTTKYSLNYNVKELPNYRKIDRVTSKDIFPDLPVGYVAIFISSHKKFSIDETLSIETFCEKNNAVVFCDHTSGYFGKYSINFSLEAIQGSGREDKPQLFPELLIQIGEITGDYYTLNIKSKNVWRVNEDGEIKDQYRKLTHVFEMPEKVFFDYYSKIGKKTESSYYEECLKLLKKTRELINELPFSNIWIASNLANKIPNNSVIHFAILNSLRSWNFFDLPNSVRSYSNVGGFGIDGCVSSLIGASLVNKSKLYFCITGDLAFFYDMNVLGNRHVGNNLRILVVNNGKGTEFRHNSNFATLAGLAETADNFIAAGYHFGNKSSLLLKNYSENLGFEYLTASNKEEFMNVYNRFVFADITSKSMLFEVFTNSEEESDALQMIRTIYQSKTAKMVKDVIGKNTINILKKKLGK